MTATPEAIAARREVIALLVEAGDEGLAPDDLVARCMRRVEGLTSREARRVIEHLSTGGHGRDPALLHKHGGRWLTHCKVAPPAVRVVEVQEAPPPARDPALVAEDEQLAHEQQEAPPAPQEERMANENTPRDQALAIVSKRKAWISATEVATAMEVSRGSASKALLELVSEKLVTVHGKGRATRYSLKAHQLEPLETTGASPRKAAPAKALPRPAVVPRNKRGGGAVVGSSLIEQLEAELELTKARAAKLEDAINSLRALSAAA